ncbi:MAG: hypothetical protein ABSH14_03800 [Verrucomicrobiia bacterium]|jgi:hypothetical protein
MNEIKVSVSSAVALGRRHLPLIRVNRRFFICCALCAAMFQLLLIESRVSERGQASVTRPTVRLTLAGEEAPPLQIQPMMPPAITMPPMDTLTWRSTGEDHLKSRVTRWEKFETEFGVTEPEHSAVLRSMQSAKYNLDRVVFAASEFSHNLSSMTDYEWDHGRFYRVSAATRLLREESSTQWTTVPENVHLGLDVNLVQSKPYIGVKLVIPFGN